MQQIHAKQTVSITELKKNPSKIVEDAQGDPIAILKNNTPTAYLIPAKTFEKILDLLDEQYLQEIVKGRLSDKKKPVMVKIDEL